MRSVLCKKPPHTNFLLKNDKYFIKSTLNKKAHHKLNLTTIYIILLEFGVNYNYETILYTRCDILIYFYNLKILKILKNKIEVL